MPYYQYQLSITTVDETLQQLSVDELKKLAALLNTNSKPTCKAEIIALIQRHLVGENLQQLWREWNWKTHERGQARLIECADAALAVLIANNSRTKKLCFLAGEKHLVIPSESETKFRNAVKKLGYSIALSDYNFS